MMSSNSPAPPGDDHLTPYVDAMKKFTGLSRATAERLAARGEIAVVKIGRRVLARPSEIQRFIATAEARTSARAAA